LSAQIQTKNWGWRKKKAYSPCFSNSNPATIMTDKNIADKIYIEPLTLTTIKRIIEKERTPCISPMKRAA
jgi:carbamoylphosphate synthase large subunit